MSRRTLKVVRIIARLNIGGPARHAIILSDRLRQRGYETLLVFGAATPSEGNLEDLVSARSCRFVKVPALERSIRPWHDAQAFSAVLRLIRAERPDIVHTHTAKAGVLGRLAAFGYNTTLGRGEKCLVVHTFHGHVLRGYFGRVGSAAARVSERALANLTDRIVTISSSQRDEIVNELHVAPAHKTVVLPLGLELGELLNDPLDCSLRAEWGYGSEDIVFGYVGRFVPIKNLFMLIRAFAAVVEQIPPAKLLLVGDGECRAAMEALATRLQLKNSVRFAGWRRDLARIYGAIDIVVLASSNEGTPVALIEAMASARPVVATQVGGVADLVRNGETGLLVRPDDLRGFAAAMVRLASAASERSAMGAAGRRDVAVRFDSSRLVTDLDNMYRTALNEKRGFADSVRQP